MNRTKQIIIFLLILLSYQLVIAQDVQFSQLFADKLYLNPAYAGLKYCPRIALSYRNQWLGIQISISDPTLLAMIQYAEDCMGGLWDTYDERPTQGRSISIHFSGRTLINSPFRLNFKKPISHKVFGLLERSSYIFPTGSGLNPNGTFNFLAANMEKPPRYGGNFFSTPGKCV